MKLHWTLSDPFEQAIQTVVAESSAANRRVATFDADGTLWDRDIGEAFLRWLIKGNHLLGLQAFPDVYEEYERRVAEDRTAGYGWAIQVLKGLPVDAVTGWAAQFAYAWPNYRPGMKAIVQLLESQGVECWIVSASGELIVREAAPYAGISVERTRGIRSVAKDGVFTDQLVTPLTCNQGKVELIRQVIGVKPLLAFGDSMGDLEMLEFATYPMVVALNQAPNEKLLALAAQRSWPVQRF